MGVFGSWPVCSLEVGLFRQTLVFKGFMANKEDGKSELSVGLSAGRVVCGSIGGSPETIKTDLFLEETAPLIYCLKTTCEDVGSLQRQTATNRCQF